MYSAHFRRLMEAHPRVGDLYGGSRLTKTRRFTVLIGSTVALAGASVTSPITASGADGTAQSAALGTFSSQLVGVSLFRQSGTTVSVDGRYFALRPNRSFFTVAYGNTNCDPAKAFPVGPFTTDRRGRGALDRSVTAPAGLIAGTMSVSVRRGDDHRDLDGDGITGPGDVVAIAGQPGVGLVECDTSPATTG